MWDSSYQSTGQPRYKDTATDTFWLSHPDGFYHPQRTLRVTCRPHYTPVTNPPTLLGLPLLTAIAADTIGALPSFLLLPPGT